MTHLTRIQNIARGNNAVRPADGTVLRSVGGAQGKLGGMAQVSADGPFPGHGPCSARHTAYAAISSHACCTVFPQLDSSLLKSEET